MMASAGFKREPREIVLGIDAGTSEYCVAQWDEGRDEATVIFNNDGAPTTPAFLGLFPDGSMRVGAAARRLAATEPRRVVFESKRMLGRRFSDPALQADMTRWPFTVRGTGSEGEDPVVVFPATSVEEEHLLLTPQDVTMRLLRGVARDALQGIPSTRGSPSQDMVLQGGPRVAAVITVPAYFDSQQRSLTRDAGRRAGLDVLGILAEPTAAALAYNLHTHGTAAHRRVLVYDLGGGTFDVTVLEMEEGELVVRATGGDTHLGGADVDAAVQRAVMQHWSQDYPGGFQGHPGLRSAVRRAKHQLAHSATSHIELDAASTGGGTADGVTLTYTLTRELLSALASPLVARTLRIVEDVLGEARVHADDLDDVVLVGGSTRLTCVVEALAQRFGADRLRADIDPDTVVAMGAAVQAALLAHPAAVPQSLLDRGIMIQDVLPRSLGVAVRGTDMSILLARNAPIPSRETRIFTTYRDLQTSLLVAVYQGESGSVAQNTHLGTFRLSGIPAHPRGGVEIPITFRVDGDGILHVTASETSTGTARELRVSLSDTPEETAALDPEAEASAQRLSALRADLWWFASLARGRIMGIPIVLLEPDTRTQQAGPSDRTALQQAALTVRDGVVEVCDAALHWLDRHPDGCEEDTRAQLDKVQGIVRGVERAMQRRAARDAFGISDAYEDVGVVSRRGGGTPLPSLLPGSTGAAAPQE